MPSFNEAVGVIVTLIVLTVASGRGEFIWKAIGEVRRVAMINSRKDWGCPSIFDKGVCGNFEKTALK